MSETYASIEYRRILDERARTAKLREARQAKELALQADNNASVRRIKHIFEAKTSNNPDFWANIDRSGGPSACHPWTGQVNDNENFPCPHFTQYGYASARRVLCVEVFGRAPPASMEISTPCDEHLCMNIDHMTVGPRRPGDRASKSQYAKPLVEFFCEPVPA